MHKKRLIGVITVKDGMAVQSFGYRRYLPLGRPEILAENLDRWGCDEILVLAIDRSRRNMGPDIELLRALGALGLSTPLSYGGGICTAQQAGLVIQSGAERICLDAALHRDTQPIREIAERLGVQALIGVLPVSLEDNLPQWFDYQTRRSVPLFDSPIPALAEGLISELLVVDWVHEGERNAFNNELVRHSLFGNLPIIAFGGISEPLQAISLLSHPQVAAVAVGNFLNYTEHAVQRLKEHMDTMPIRPPMYATDY